MEKVITAGRYRLDGFQRRQRLREVREGLSDNEVHPFFFGPMDLLFEHCTSIFLAFGIVFGPNVGVADVACHQRVALCRYVFRDSYRLSIHFFQSVLQSDQSQFLSVRVVSEGLDNV